MPKYEWSGISRNGERSAGVIAAGSSEEVSRMLRQQRIRVTHVAPAQEARFSLWSRAQKVGSQDLAIFTRQFSVMIDAGLPLVQCLDTLSRQTDNKALGRVLEDVRNEMEGGANLADALRRHPRVFNELYCNMVEAGETGGILDTILRRLANYIEKAVKLKRAVRSASIYPGVIITVAVLVVFVILWKVIPTFAALFSGLGAQLPLPTRVVIMASNFVGAYALYIIVLAAAAVWGVRNYYRTDNGELLIDSMLLKAPVLGVLVRKIAVARFCRTLATLVTSGVPILESLDITASTAGNRVVRDAVEATRQGIERGRSLAEPLSDSGVFPPMVTQMIAVGEETGALDAMLAKVADFYEDEVDSSVENLMTLLEPLMIVFLGVVVGGIVVSMYLPMFDLINKI